MTIAGTFDDSISGSDLAGNIPVEYVPEIMKGTVENSNAMRLATRLPDMPTATRIMPVLDSLPIAYFSTGEADQTQTSDVKWRNVSVTAEELNVIVPIPKTAFDDANQPIWPRVQPLIQQAAGKAIDQAIFYGTNSPSSWDTALGAAGLVAGCAAVSDAAHTVSLAACDDMYEALLGEAGVLSLLEEEGFMATGHVAHTSMRGKLRGVRDADGQPLFRNGMNDSTRYVLDGSPIDFPVNGSVVKASSLLIAGQWTELVYAMRQDITWFVANQGVIQDGNGAIQFNLFQNRMVALMLTMRLGVALPNPVNALEETQANRYPFAVLTA
jgi:HK97 family phage major capsid protein